MLDEAIHRVHDHVSRRHWVSVKVIVTQSTLTVLEQPVSRTRSKIRSDSEQLRYLVSLSVCLWAAYAVPVRLTSAFQVQSARYLPFLSSVLKTPIMPIKISLCHFDTHPSTLAANRNCRIFTILHSHENARYDNVASVVVFLY